MEIGSLSPFESKGPLISEGAFNVSLCIVSQQSEIIEMMGCQYPEGYRR